MNNDKKRTFIRSNSFNLRLNYDKKANSNNKIIIEQQLKKRTKNSDSMFIEKEVKIPEKKDNFKHIKGIVFGKRERWQVVKSISEHKELEYLPRKKRVVSINAANWDHFFEKTQTEVRKPCVKACQQKVLENSISSRTIYPDADTSISKLYTRKLDYPSRLKSTATGSLSNLLECTSRETPKNIRTRKQDSISLILKPDSSSIVPYRRNRSYVDLQAIKRDSSFAGINSEYKREDVFTKLPHKNYSSHKKYLDLTSSIFPNDNSLNNSFFEAEKKQRLVLNNYKTAFLKNRSDLNDSRNFNILPATDRIKEKSNIIYSVDVIDNTKKKNVGIGMKKMTTLNPLSNYSTKVNSMTLSKKNSQEV